jgi:hypothetical protein
MLHLVNVTLDQQSMLSIVDLHLDVGIDRLVL